MVQYYQIHFSKIQIQLKSHFIPIQTNKVIITDRLSAIVVHMFTVVIYCTVFVYILRKTKKAGYGETSNNKCGDRMPLISIMKAKVLAFHITACVGDNLNFGWNSNQDPNYPESSGLTKGKWYLVEVKQEYRTSTSSSSSGYYWQIQINGLKVIEKLNDKPREFNDLVVYASNPWSTGTVHNHSSLLFSLV